MKLLVAFLVALAVYLFYPTYNLMEEDPLAQTAALIDTGFITESRCQAEANSRKLKYHQCIKTRVWSQNFSHYRKYTEEKER